MEIVIVTVIGLNKNKFSQVIVYCFLKDDPHFISSTISIFFDYFYHYKDFDIGTNSWLVISSNDEEEKIKSDRKILN